MAMQRSSKQTTTTTTTENFEYYGVTAEEDGKFSSSNGTGTSFQELSQPPKDSESETPLQADPRKIVGRTFYDFLTEVKNDSRIIILFFIFPLLILIFHY